jgi:hypothetical protein
MPEQVSPPERLQAIHQPVTFIGRLYEKIKNDILYRDEILKQELL